MDITIAHNGKCESVGDEWKASGEENATDLTRRVIKYGALD